MPTAKAAKTADKTSKVTVVKDSGAVPVDSIRASVQGARLTLQLQGSQPSLVQLDLDEFPVARFALAGKGQTELVFIVFDETLPIASFASHDAAVKALAEVHAALTSRADPVSVRHSGGFSLWALIKGLAKWLFRLLGLILILALAYWGWTAMQPAQIKNIPGAENSDLDTPTTDEAPVAKAPTGVPVSADDVLE